MKEYKDFLVFVSLRTEFCFIFFFSVKEQRERPSQRITLDLQGVGLSLVNNEKSIEVAYIGIRP